jgi:hypothetical protein
MNGIVHGYRSFAGALLGKDGVQPAIQAMLQEARAQRRRSVPARR